MAELFEKRMSAVHKVADYKKERRPDCTKHHHTGRYAHTKVYDYREIRQVSDL